MIKVGIMNIAEVVDEYLGFTVTFARYGGKWIFGRRRDGGGFDVPGGRRESGETIFETAKRELFEESGATDADITPICA